MRLEVGRHFRHDRVAIGMRYARIQSFVTKRTRRRECGTSSKLHACWNEDTLALGGPKGRQRDNKTVVELMVRDKKLHAVAPGGPPEG